ncbi:MAG TPA: hypothetical protein VJT09_03865 [Pyrinomonadaceae bacterium]|nr:hypothetical protein [Pyrinomonadaceae bacterium]
MGAIALKRRRQEKARKKGSAPVEWSQTSWGQRLIKSATLVIALLCTASITLADIKITTKSSTGGQSITSTTYFKGARQRTEGMGYTSIYQCDLKRVIQINDKTKTYLIAPFASQEGAKGAARQTPAAGTRRGGVITYTTSSVDTGERKEILGMTAKRIKSKTVVAASEGACSSMNMEMETDGWYVDLPAGLSCPTDGSAQPSFVEQSDCVDEVRFKTEGVARTGYPVMTTTSIKFNTPGVSIPTSTSTQEVVDVSRAAVDSSLFEIPAGYTEVKSMQELGSPY